MLMKLSSWVTSNATLRVGSYNVTHHHMGVFKKNFVVVIFGVWIFGLLQIVSTTECKVNKPVVEVNPERCIELMNPRWNI